MTRAPGLGCGSVPASPRNAPGSNDVISAFLRRDFRLCHPTHRPTMSFSLRPRIDALRCRWTVGFLLALWTSGVTAVGGQATGGGREGDRARIVFLIGEDEYRTWETLPEFARTEVAARGHEVRIVQADPADKHRFPGLLDALREADLLVVSVRRRALPREQLDAVRAHLAAGRPLVGIRTTSHAFAPRGEDASKGEAWPTFDPEVLGGHYHGHHGSGPRTVLRPAPGEERHPVFDGVVLEGFSSVASLYRVRPLEPGTTPLLLGAISGQPEEPVAWLHRYGPAAARVFYTSLGHPEDFASPAFRRFLWNGMVWALNQDVISQEHFEQGGVPERIQPATKPLPPGESARRFTVAEGLEMELLLSEPEIAQPLQIHFDERGRLWLVEYRQYPAPAGLTLVSHDQFWRAVYDRVPPPPPGHFRGKDRVSIHEDTDGDGTYDRHSVFVDGLNIVTSIAVGRGGVWVLNPPYLLYYADRNRDDLPDGDPEVHLEGFGLEDTHSVVNSLRWGPDGWLYAAQGSTVSGRVRRPGTADVPVQTLGQNIWRYHPETRRYEVFAEGGGNAFGVEIDDAGRIFSGHNGGNTRGFHYVQGGYLQKGFEKHGQLSNPHAYGYFPPMAHPAVERFTHTFVLYGGGTLSAAFDGRLFGLEPLQGRIVMSTLERDGATFRTQDVGYAVTSADPWFKPVDIRLGPDGFLYVADWYDFQVNHWRNYQGNMDASNGRVYRLKAQGAKPVRPEDLGQFSGERLVEALDHANRWVRQTALRVLADRREASLADGLADRLSRTTGDRALDLLWGLQAVGGLTTERARRMLDHPHPRVREWTVRLLGDDPPVPQALAGVLADLARREPDLEVRVQLAATARRLPASQAVGILRALLRRDEDASDARQPLMVWWAVEAHADQAREAMLGLLEEPSDWGRPMVIGHLLEHLMRRYAAAGGAADLDSCTVLLRRAPTAEARSRLLAGLEAGIRHRGLAGLPRGLLDELARTEGGSLPLQLRVGRAGALESGVRLVEDEAADLVERVQVIQTFGEMKESRAVPALLTAARSAREPVRVAALAALRAFDRDGIGDQVLGGLAGSAGATRTAALSLLVSRPSWSRQLVEAVARGEVAREAVGGELVRQLKRHKDPALAALVNRVWPDTRPPTTEAMEREITRVAGVLRAGRGDPYNGKKLFTAACGACHTLFHAGGMIGPDLTPFRRDDLDSLLLSIVNPSAEIREGYENSLLETRDEQSLSGFIVRQDDRVVVLRGLDGQDIAIERAAIAELRAAGISLMPEGLLEGMDDQQLRDLFAYLRSSQPLAN